MERINGYNIIATFEHAGGRGLRAGRMILVDREQEYDRFVTAWQGQDDGKYDTQWCWGHYFGSIDDALPDFHDRCQKVRHNYRYNNALAGPAKA